MLPALASAPQAHAAAIIVNSTADTVVVDGKCTLREAILNANADNQLASTDCAGGVGLDDITFDLAPGSTITLTGSRLPTIISTATINGFMVPGLKISGNKTSGVFAVNSPGMQVALKWLAIVDGDARNYVGDSTGFNGGGLYVFAGSVMLESVSMSDNIANFGGAVYSNGALEIRDSSIHHNRSIQSGGGIYNTGALQISSSTISTNRAEANGGGVFSADTNPARPSLAYSTIASNVAAGEGGGIYAGTGLLIRASILAYNTALGGPGPDCRTSALDAQGPNLIETGSGCAPLPPPESGLLLGFDPLLAPLAANGGTTANHAPLPGSPVIDKIDWAAVGCNWSALDQRRVLRPSGERCEIGAVEFLHQGPAFIITHTADRPTVARGQSVDFTIVVRNGGTTPMHNVIITAIYSDGLKLESVRPSFAEQGDGDSVLVITTDVLEPAHAHTTVVKTRVNLTLQQTLLRGVVTAKSDELGSTPPVVASVLADRFLLNFPLMARSTPR